MRHAVLVAIGSIYHAVGHVIHRIAIICIFIRIDVTGIVRVIFVAAAVIVVVVIVIVNIVHIDATKRSGRQ